MKRILFILWVLLSVVPQANGQSVHYDVFLNSPETHFFRVEMTVENAPNSNTLNVAIPAWCCLYQIRDFAQYVQNVRVETRGQSPLKIGKIDKNTWQVTGDIPETVRISYRVFGNNLSPFGTQLNTKHAFINPALILFYVVQGRDWPVTVVYHKPKDWTILTAAQKVKGRTNVFEAHSYDALVDNPVEIGRFKKISFQRDGATYEAAFYDYHNEFSLNKFGEMLKRIVHTETIDLMHDVPFKRYVFIFQIVDSYGSGMEHANSSVISFNRQRAATDVFDLTSLIAHEFFHVWNVKRIKPKNLFRYDWTKENYTRALWFAEGGTCYYAALVRERAGFWNRQQLLDHFAERITQEENDPGRFVESPEQASFNAWFEKYPWYVRPENSISYYRSGEILSFLLDLKIRLSTKNRFSLDDVLRTMNGLFAKRNIPYNDSDDILAVMNSLTGKDYSLFFRKYISGEKRPPYETIFQAAGLNFRKEERQIADPGFFAERNFDQPFVVTKIVAGSPAEKAGLQVNDWVLEVNGKPTGLYIEDSFKNLKAGDSVILRIKRGNKEKNLTYKIRMKLKKQYVLTEGKRLSGFQNEMLKQWFAGKP